MNNNLLASLCLGFHNMDSVLMEAAEQQDEVAVEDPEQTSEQDISNPEEAPQQSADPGQEQPEEIVRDSEKLRSLANVPSNELSKKDIKLLKQYGLIKKKH